MHQFSFPISQNKTKNPFEIVHSDLWGPSPHLSTEGYKYYIHFVDDLTRFTWIFPLKTKSEAYSKVVQFQTFVERQFEHKFKCLQTDRGGKYRSLVPFLQNLGIQFKHPCPHTHQQHGKAKRKRQHIVEMGLTLLAQAKLPLKFWWDSFVAVVYLINRLPTPVLDHSSPYQKLYGQKPDYFFLKVFGCACFPYLRLYNAHKLEFRTSNVFF